MNIKNNIRLHPKRGKVNNATSKICSQLFINTNLDLCILGALFAFHYSDSLITSDALQFEDGEDRQLESTTQDSPSDQGIYAILFPWFAQTIAVFIYYILSRYLTFLPYTAIVFLFGVVIGAVLNPSVVANREQNALAYSASIWLNIDGLVILLVFLPGLIFNDAYTINVHLLFQSFWQLIIFAFPMVLGGTYLTALVTEYLLMPLDWPHTLCMVFGAILSGTDPIAVAGLLKSAGAPDRLNMHISGESLLNDGSVVCFFNVFSKMYYHENDFHEDSGKIKYTVGTGFAYFFQLTLGGCAIGLAFGLGTVFMLKALNRRLSERENLMQVVLLVSSAYLGYFTAEVIAQCSGIIATITCGLTVKVFGETFINDHELTLHFWAVTAELLNQLLFVLGGVLWGDIVSRNSFGQTFFGWGYLVLVYVLLIVIRFVLVFGLYPVISRIGIGTNVKESIFMSYAGFRGTVGIALALSLNSTVHKYSIDEKLQQDTDALFVMVGGISVMTLLINGMTSGPLLRALNLTATEKTRRKVVDNYMRQMIQACLQEYVKLLSQPRWKGIDHSIIKEHVPFLNDISFDDLMVAVERHQNNTPVHLYVKPRLEHVFAYLDREKIKHRVRQLSSRSANGDSLFKSQSSQNFERLLTQERSFRSPATRKEEDKRMWNDFFSAPTDQKERSVENSDDTNEARLTYIEILKSAYYQQIEDGSLEEFGDLPYSLFQGLHFCEDTCAKGHPLNDWEATKVASATRVVLANNIFPMLLLRTRQFWRRERKCCSGTHWLRPAVFETRFLIRLNLAFVGAHRYAMKVFESQFASNPLTSAEKQILEESQAQIKHAEADLNIIDQVDVMTVKGHLLTLILLKKSVQFVEKLSRQNLIPEAAASDLLEKLDRYVENVSLCDKLDPEHDGRLSTTTKIIRLRQLPNDVIKEFNILAAIDEMPKTMANVDIAFELRKPYQSMVPAKRDSFSLTVSNAHRADDRTDSADSDQHTATIPTRGGARANLLSVTMGHTESHIEGNDVPIGNDEDDTPVGF